MTKKSPTQKSLKLFRDNGFTCAITERWNPFSKTRQDLFGFIDLLGLDSAQLVAIQVTTKANMSARKNKILDNNELKEILIKWLSSGNKFQIHGWKDYNCTTWNFTLINRQISYKAYGE